MSKRKAFGDNSPAPSDDDSDFDDDEDPDNLEVPGGGKTLAAAARLGDKTKIPQTSVPVTVKATTNPLAAPSGLAFGQMSNVKPIKISASSLTKPINLGLGRGAAAPVASFAAGSSAYNAASLLAQTIIRRRVECVSDNGTVLLNSACVYSDQPEKTKRESQSCKPVWAVGPWSKCKGPCGQGLQHRVLRCVWRASTRSRSRRSRERPAAACARARPAVVRNCTSDNCLKDGVCRDTSRFCENVRAMNMCALRRYKEQCCKTCED